MKLKQRLLALLATMIFLLVSSSFSYATGLDDKKQIDSVKMSIEKAFKEHIGAIEADKVNFGLTHSESYSNAVLGDGVPYYVISSDFLLGNSQDYKSALSLDGYIFPIKIGSKAAGIVVAKEIDGKWDIYKMTNNVTFEQDIAGAKKNLKDNSSAKLVFDDNFHLYALAAETETGYDILPMRDFGDFKKDQLKSLEETGDKFRKAYNERVKDKTRLGGNTEFGESKDRGNLFYFMIGLVIIAITITTFTIYRKTKHI